MNEHMEHSEGAVVFQHACKMGLEGIVSKPCPQPLVGGCRVAQCATRARPHHVFFASQI
jgi:hypothetical protein